MSADITSPHSCQHCQRLVLDACTKLHEFPPRFDFDFTVQDLVAGAKAECKLCQWITDQFRDVKPPANFTLYAENPDGNKFQISSFSHLGLRDPQGHSSKIFKTRVSLKLSAYPTDPASKDIWECPINTTPASDASLELMRSWLRDCETNHPRCKLKIRPAMPIRLVEIAYLNGHFELRLRKAATLGQVRFATLSYCWGGDQPIKCLLSNVEEYEHSILFHSLPSTIRNSITICYELGLRYLWIDALCITQDDDTEKSGEIAKMQQIYGNSEITIAASRANSVTEGFLHERVIDVTQFKLTWRTRSGELGSIIMLEMPEQFSREPLDTRAWALQERVLSRRLLGFGTLQTRWFCQDKTPVKIDGWNLHDSIYGLSKQDLLDISQYTEHSETYSLLPKTIEDHLDDWSSIVEAYTQRSLTIPTDRVLGISGIAEAFAIALKSDYVMGLWKICLPDGLCWRVEGESVQLRPVAYQGPSWSWTSINGVILDAGLGPQEHEPGDYQAEVIECSGILENELALYGAIRQGSARLTLHARIATGTIVVSQNGGKNDVHFTGKNESGPTEATVEMWIDAESLTAVTFPITLLEIFSKSYESGWFCRGLVLRQLDSQRKVSKLKRLINLRPFRLAHHSEGLFSRIGMFQLSGGYYLQIPSESDEAYEKRRDRQGNWFKYCKRSIVDII